MVSVMHYDYSTLGMPCHKGQHMQLEVSVVHNLPLSFAPAMYRTLYTLTVDIFINDNCRMAFCRSSSKHG